VNPQTLHADNRAGGVLLMTISVGFMVIAVSCGLVKFGKRYAVKSCVDRDVVWRANAYRYVIAG
jgi:hypothetical protein